MNKADINEQKFFEKNGYLYFESFFLSESDNLLKNIDKIFNIKKKNSSKKKYGFVDGVTFNKCLWDLILNHRLLKKIKLILGEDFKYIRHSDIHVNYKGGLIHRDSSNRYIEEKSNWNEKNYQYKIIRIAIYLTDYTSTESSIILFPGTHKKEVKIERLKINLYNFIKSKLRKIKIDNLLTFKFFFKNVREIKNKKGDLVIFDQRILHAGGNTLFKKQPKYSIFLGFGARNQHTLDHENFYSNRKGYDKEIPIELKEKLIKNNIL